MSLDTKLAQECSRYASAERNFDNARRALDAATRDLAVAAVPSSDFGGSALVVWDGVVFEIQRPGVTSTSRDVSITMRPAVLAT